jgi:hypothetical protein
MTPSLHHWRPLSRSDRYVRRASLRLPSNLSEHRASFLLEEALRLVSLPGEDQGRTYYFRRVALRGLSASALPGDWIDRAQSTMHDLAARAVHGTAPHAADSAVVFFNSHEEALGWLLRRIFRASLSSADWFVPLIAPIAKSSDRGMQAAAVIERLRSLPAGWFAAATVLVDDLEADSAAFSTLEAIPERFVRAWLSELGGASPGAGQAPRISTGRRRMLLRLLAERSSPALQTRLESASPHASVETAAPPTDRREPPLSLVWLGALAVVAEHPGEAVRGAAASAGRAVLEELAESLAGPSSKELRDRNAPVYLERPATPRPVRGSQQEIESPERALESRPREDLKYADSLEPDAGPTADQSQFSTAGGLYFLLNTLRYLGIEAALEALPATHRRVFLRWLIESLARAASVAHDDPALLLTAAALEAGGREDSVKQFFLAAECWPRTVPARPDKGVTLDRVIRLWMLAVRRWCWRNADLTLREIVSRPARVLLTRTDLDVTLPMTTVDIRLRRIGLDLDPGWLPWFGRVVRFHYVDELPRHGVPGGASL